MSGRPLAALLAALTAVALAPPAALAAGWRAPVDGRVVGRFHLGPDPFAAGQRRGVDLAAAPGAPALAPCRGRVTFAGRVPGRAGVAIRCGPLVATVLGLAGLEVATGDVVARGRRLGAVAAGGVVRLGARRAGERFGYRDPLALFAPRRAPRGPHAPPPPRASPPAPGPPARAPAPVRAAPPARAPLLAWAGAGLAALALPAGAAGARARARARRRAPSSGVAAAPE
ncbi:MAG TPA: peptidoglycan DD-metalloendopeptidase family protein [Capillimicrobium sp.]|nr:peptidoglycan DD-metalloendopeptidase family protein [Capillimicrobium sp.]